MILKLSPICGMMLYGAIQR